MHTTSKGAWDFDAVVIGGGPGGSSAATALARRGRRVLLLEREQFPRFHIGESQLPWTNEILRALGAYDTVAGAGFVRKWGASFWTLDGSFEQHADFAEAPETPTPQTFQVPRETFDEILLRHSEKAGVDVRERHRVLDVVFDPEGVTLRFADPEDGEHSVRAGVVVDASGRAGFLAKKFGRHAFDPLLRNIAVHAQFEDIPRPTGRRSGDIRMFTRPDMGWLWLIPLSDTVTSVGAVIPQAVHRRESRATPEESLAHYVESTPLAAKLLAPAHRITPARFDADYSYLGTEMAGDRWVAVGDAAAFLDPIFSTGVLMAMQGGLESAEAIDAGLRDGDLSKRRFRLYEQLVRMRYHHFRRFAVGFYNPNFRDLWFQRTKRGGLFEAVLSILAGNWHPSLAIRLRIRFFFTLVALQRVFPIAPRGPRTPAETP